MKIQISYFSSRAPRERKVCIAKGYPRFLPGLVRAGYFTPSDPKAKDWQAAYRADLDTRFPTPETLLASLRELCKETPEPILCCYEKNPADCHRSVLAAYIKEKLDIEVTEWQPGAETPAPKPRKKPAAGMAQLLLL